MTLINRISFYLLYSLRSLQREGMRTFLAGLSVAFGVLSLVSMQILSGTLLHSSMFDERLQLGGDAQIYSSVYGEPFTQAELDQITTWQQAGLISQSTPLTIGSARYLRTQGNGRVTFLYNVFGFDPATYPLVGEFVLREPTDVPVADLLAEPTSAFLTRDLADSLRLHVGDTFILSGGDVAPTRLTLVGIVNATPNRQGKAIFYSLETARLLENRQNVITAISIQWGDVPNAQQTIVDSPLNVFVARDRLEVPAESVSVSLFDVMLKGAGVLGLLVGGLGVSNTLQVILARRKLEIAMLKTLGYRRHNLFIIIGLETGILGLISSVIGAAAGVALGNKFLEMLGSLGVLMVQANPDVTVILGGILAGASTAIVFGLQSILASSATRPIELLRDLPAKPDFSVLAGRGALFGILILVFGALVGVVLGSILQGILFVMGGGLLLLVLRGVFWLMLWFMLILPIPAMPMLKLARASLRRRKLQSSIVLIALFAGAFSVTFAALVTYNAQVTLNSRRPSDGGYNLLVFTSPENADNVLGQMLLQGIDSVYTRYQVNGSLNGEPITIEGRPLPDLAADIVLDNTTWNGAPDTALLPQSYTQGYATGDTITLEANGETQTIQIAGFYTTVGDYSTHITDVAAGIIVAPETAIALGGTRTQVSVIASIPVEGLNAATDTLGVALPDDLVFSKADINNLMVATYQSLFTLGVAVAGLAFVAGAVLIANSAALTVVERRREIGVFKATGYTSGHVLRLLLSEYGILGFIAGLWGIIGAIIVVILINFSQGINLILEPTILGGMLLLSMAIAIISAAVVAWQPTRVRPLDVLRYE
jgi:putative ABC transport system permease protein